MARVSVTCLTIATVASLLLANLASAGSHLWRFSEFYSSPDRKIQFIEYQGTVRAVAKTQSFDGYRAFELPGRTPFGA